MEKNTVVVDGCEFECWPSGNIKDQETKTHVAHYGKVFRKATPEQYAYTAFIAPRVAYRNKYGEEAFIQRYGYNGFNYEAYKEKMKNIVRPKFTRLK